MPNTAQMLHSTLFSQVKSTNTKVHFHKSSQQKTTVCYHKSNQLQVPDVTFYIVSTSQVNKYKHLPQVKSTKYKGS